MERRQFVKSAFFFAGVLSLNHLIELFSSQSKTWDLSVLKNLTPGQKIDLSQTLPRSIKKGGRFSLDPQSAPLPNSLSLSPDGILMAHENADCFASGIVFSYQEPETLIG